MSTSQRPLRPSRSTNVLPPPIAVAPHSTDLEGFKPKSKVIEDKPSSKSAPAESRHAKKYTIGELEKKYRRAQAAEVEERKKRAEAEGQAEGWKRDVERMKVELEILRARSSTAIEPVNSEKVKSRRNDGDAERRDMEKKLQELVEQHKVTKAQCKKQMDSMTSDHEKLQAEYRDLQRSYRRAKADLQLRETETRATSSSEHHDHTSWKRQTQSMEIEMEKIRQERNEALEKASVQEELLEQSAQAFARLYHSTVPKAKYLSLKTDLVIERSARIAAESNMKILSREGKIMREEKASWKQRYLLVKEQLVRSEEDQRNILLSKRQDRANTRITINCIQQDLEITSDSLDSIIDVPVLELSEILYKHNTISSEYYTSTIQSLQSHIQELTTDIISNDLSHSQLESTLTDLQSTHTNLQKTHETLISAHNHCAPQISELDSQIKSLGVDISKLKSELHDIRVERDDFETRCKEAKEGLKRANEVVGRVKIAEGALVEELNELQERYDLLVPFETLYHDLKESYNIMQSRESMMLEEVERIGHQNAELLGHGNDNQKISYIDGIRKEMALVKHELATTRYQLNSANDQIQLLHNEIGAYKSIGDNNNSAPSGGFGGSINSINGRMRISRIQRQPEGSALPSSVLLGSSSRRSVGNLRSVSGPTSGRF